MDTGNQARNLEAVSEIAFLALERIRFLHLLDRASEVVAEILDAEYGGVFELAPDRQSLRLVAGRGWSPDTIGNTRVAATWKLRHVPAMLSNEPIIVEDLRGDDRFSDQRFLHEHHVISGISIVIPGNDNPYRILAVYSTRLREFSSEDVHFVQCVANLIGVGVKINHAEDQVQQHKAMVKTIVDASRIFAEVSVDPHVVSHALARYISEYFGDLCIVHLLADNGQRLNVAAMFHPDSGVLGALRESLINVPLRDATALTNHLAQTTELPGAIDAPDEQPVHSVALSVGSATSMRTFTRISHIPLRSQGRVTGAISTWRDRPESSLSADEMRLLQELADRAALAIDNALLYQRLREHEHRVRAAVHGSMSTAATRGGTPLTAREQEVLRLMAQGETNAGIGQALGVSTSTAKAHVEHIVNKLRARNRTEAAVRAAALGILHFEP